MKQEWDDTCGAACTLAAVTNEPKIHGVAAAGEAHAYIGVRILQRGRGSGYHYVNDTEVGADLRGDNGVLGFWNTRRMCVFDIHAVDTNADTNVGM